MAPNHEAEAKVRLARIGFDNVLGALKYPVETFLSHQELIESLSPCRRRPRRTDQLRAEPRARRCPQPSEVALGTIADARMISLPALGKGGEAVVFLDGTEVGRGSVDATQAFLFSYDETCDIGRDDASPVSDDYTSPASKFTGTVNWVQLDQGTDDQDHLISPEERLRVAMARQ